MYAAQNSAYNELMHIILIAFVAVFVFMFPRAFFVTCLLGGAAFVAFVVYGFSTNWAPPAFLGFH